MLKREIIRIGILAIIGFMVSLFVHGEEKSVKYYAMLILPFYFVGMFYAGKTLLRLLVMIIKTYFSYQFMSLLINPLVGTILCMLLFTFGIAAIFCIGWLIGLGKCIYCLITAHQLDKQCMRMTTHDFW